MIHSQYGAHNTDRHIAQIADKDHQGLHHTCQALGPESALFQLSVHFLKLLSGLLFSIVSLDHRMAGINLLDLPVQFAQMALLAGKYF